MSRHEAVLLDIADGSASTEVQSTVLAGPSSCFFEMVHAGRSLPG